MSDDEIKDNSEGDGVLVADVSDDVDLDSISDIPVEITAVLGSCTMAVSQLLKLGRGAVVTLNRKVGEPIEIFVNNRLVAKGEVVIVENKIGVTMTEIIRSEKD
ncbi:MAG: flagellar motor switch protein FliN [Alphaproteobacteria bacterium CG11_big_fil_rev_8_21_14_0_20_39_49]|nr:MAG: flagellar motor switch protein FliN [Alphaproteobacteria bacterium CG11_big_fil_rev_8_21_14_0_20_39_49]